MTLERILSPDEERLLASERTLLADVRSALEGAEATQDDLATLNESVQQLDDLFLLVVVGEFNAGKSAFVNALLGEAVLAEGVTPTTSGIHLLRHGDAVSRERGEDGFEVVHAPLDLLREVTLVDTPGTNSLDRRHEALTARFVPRSDLVLFVTSADRPFSESERAFLERIKGWGKKVVMVVNKVDILPGEDEVGEVLAYVEEHGRELLTVTPPVFPLSALRARRAREAGDEAGVEGSGLAALERYLRTTLDETGRVRLKLANPLGVAASLLERYLNATDELLSTLADDLQTVADIERQIAAWAEDVDREFDLRLADISNILHVMERRGIDFFDDRLRLVRLPQLLRSAELRRDFEQEVVADSERQIEDKVESLIDWLVSGDLAQWQAVVRHTSRRRAEHSDRIVGEIASGFESNRAELLQVVGRTAREALARYDRSTEARRMAESVQQAIASTALVEVGAVGLGATLALVLSGTTADATGILAAGTVAAIGLFILPARRRRAKRELTAKVTAMREELVRSLRAGFDREAERSRSRIGDAVAPYARFVRSENDRLVGQRERLAELGRRVAALQAAVAEIS